MGSRLASFSGERLITSWLVGVWVFAAHIFCGDNVRGYDRWRSKLVRLWWITESDLPRVCLIAKTLRLSQLQQLSIM